ncbi:MAG: FHA domain-containing protein [Ruminococcus sp.]|nr:FHA domain-containing protein [Ruminococcus sp.]
MSEFLEMLASLDVPDLVLCAIAVIILDIFALSVIMAANRESKLCKKRWKHVSAEMELCFKEHCYPLEADEILLGRHIAADIRFSDPSISRYHAVMTVTNGVWSITDLDARSGTFVNDRRIQHCRLQPGDSIRLGNTTLDFCRHVPEERKRGGRRV